MPGRDVAFLDKDQNIVAWVDRQLMPGHLYEDSARLTMRATPKDCSAIFRPSAPRCSDCWPGFGCAAQRDAKTKALGLAAGAAVCLALGYLWSIWFPLNKNMWTSSYVLVAAGWSLLLFALVLLGTSSSAAGAGRAWSKRLVWPWLVLRIERHRCLHDQRTAGHGARADSLYFGHAACGRDSASSMLPSRLHAHRRSRLAGVRSIRSSIRPSALFRCGCSTARRSF